MLGCYGKWHDSPKEEDMQVMKFISLAAILATVVALAVAQQTQTPPTIKRVPITNASSNSGNEMFNSYCAVCHGKDGKGNGPAASAMKTSPAAHVAAVIRGQATTRSHGSKDMPVWGPLFASLSQGQEAQVQQRISNLVSKIETLQTK